MGTRVASILAEIGIDSKKFTSGSKGVMGGLQQMLGGFGKLIPGIGIATAAFGILVDQLNKAEQAAVESAKTDAKLEAVLKSTGNAVGMTTEELDGYATAISKASGLDDELVKNSEAVLLTFTRIGKEGFGGAMQAAVDMSAVLGQDLQGSIIQVGKAMNDFSGYTALKRAGVSFTAEQITQIANFKATNDLVGYQNLLLKELNTEFGGAAKAINDAGDGSENMTIAVGNLQEAIGEGLIPVKRNWNELMTELADSLTNTTEKVNDQRDAQERLGMQWIEGVVYYKDGVRITKEYGQALVNADRASQAWSASLEAQAEAYFMLHPEARGAIEDIDELDDNLDGVTGLFKEMTTEMLFAAAAEGLTSEQALLLAVNMGLVDHGTKVALDSVADIKKEFGETGDIDTFIDRVMVLDDNLNGLPSAKSFTYTLYGNITGSFRDALNAAGFTSPIQKPSDTASQGLGGATGLDFMVPPGYPNDSFPINVQSGEHVKVTPAGQVGEGQGFDYYMMARAFADALAVNGVLGR